MAIKGYFFNAVESGGVYDRIYNAEDVTSYLDEIVSNGVFPTPSNQLQVRASSGMTIIVGAGKGWINGHKMINTADMQLTLDNADPLANRIDRIIFYADLTNREMGIGIKKGTAGVNPTAPALTRTTTRYEMSLATIQVNKQVSAITGAMITDTRADSNVCGWVVGLIQQVDTSTLFQQWQTAYEDYYSTTKQQLDDFMKTLTQDLRVNTYVVEFKNQFTITPAGDKTINLNAASFGDDYTYEDTDVIFVYLNGIIGLLGTDYDIDTSTSPAKISLLRWNSITASQDVAVKILKSVIGIEQAITT